MIRAALAGDARALTDLATVTPGAPRWTDAQYLHMLTVAAAAHVVLVCVEAEAIVGFAALSVHPPQAELESVAVHPNVQGRGYGRALLGAALHAVQGCGVDTVFLEVRSTSAARALYGRLGFVETGVRPRYYANPADDAVLMRWSVPTAAALHQPLSGIIKGAYGS